ncbi:amino acid kinase family protein [Halopenitus persicus]|uniref:Carbamate kinase n=1 Tax=Halopenitus persicus TaxID=1048396 RepID=A0A1H3FLR3_9EURY|nr:carbamate kinase [Halopenitus persicus]SDX91288.1 carbamate kinase [Halopenitus persicus]
MEPTIIALGGNTLVSSDDADYAEQLRRVRSTVDRLEGVTSTGRTIVWTHGNGPQVGRQLLEREVADTPARPLDALVAATQGQLGYLLSHALDAHHDEAVPAVTTRVVVDPDDPAFEEPTKPVGPCYDAAEVREKPFETAPVEGGADTYRRVVPSPRPRRILEAPTIEQLVETGQSVVCCGGGGIPVADRGDGFEGQAAVVDKDYTSALVGRHLDADELVFVTDVPCAYLDYGTDAQEPIGEVDPGTLRKYLERGEFGAGSMGPKAEACASFVDEGGRRAVITQPEDLDDALDGAAGTQVR